MAFEGVAVKEKLQEYALLAEIISAICIVASLLFVGVQIKQNSESMELSAYEGFRQDFVDLQSLVVNNPQLASLLSKSFVGEELTLEEKVQLDAYAFSLFTLGDSVYRKYSRSLINEDELIDAISPIRYVIARSEYIKET